MAFFLEFEKPLVEIEAKLQELRSLSEEGKLDVGAEVRQLEAKLLDKKKEIFARLTPWQRVQLARHPQRPYTLDYVGRMITGFTELHGDRLFSDDRAIVTGFGDLDGIRVAVVGHQKGRDTRENLQRNFGSAHPEGYRKALRLMRLAGRFGIPILSFIDTPGAFPGIGAEERGQAEAIAVNLRAMMDLPVPIVVSVIGEGGSGGALGIGVGDCVLMMENAYYSVISPEGCAAILWKDRESAPFTAEALRITGKDLLSLGVVDELVREPLGGAQWGEEESARNLKRAIKTRLKSLLRLPVDRLLENRYRKFRRMGVVTEMADASGRGKK